MKIVFIITDLAMGGAEMMLLRILERLDKRYTPHVFSLATLGKIGPRIQALGVPVEALGMKAGVPNPLGFLRLIRKTPPHQGTHTNESPRVSRRLVGCGTVSSAGRGTIRWGGMCRPGPPVH